MINIKRILHPTDFSNYSKHALKLACVFAEQFDAELHLLHVINNAAILSPGIDGVIPTDYYQKLTEYALHELDELPAAQSNFTGSVIRKTCDGLPFVEIIRYANEYNIDLIIMGTHGRSGLMHIIIGSVAENVVRRAPCPVLTAHPDDYKFVMP